MTGHAIVVRGDARRLPLPDASVDMVVTSPPYYALRSYQDGGEHYDGQIGSEPTPGEWVDAMLDCTREMARVLKPTGSIFVNLGDKYASQGGHTDRGETSALQGRKHQRGQDIAAEEARRRGIGAKASREDPGFVRMGAWGIPNKSLMGLPWRYALACIDQLGLILREDVIWSKVNALPESVQDRCRRSHEYWFHFTKQPRYYSAVDEVREPHTGGAHDRGANASVRTWVSSNGTGHRTAHGRPGEFNPAGRMPGSVRQVPSQPLTLPDHLPDHYAAFPLAWPLWLICGWSPAGICVECGEGRRPVSTLTYARNATGGTAITAGDKGHNPAQGNGYITRRLGRVSSAAVIAGYACACPSSDAPTQPAVVLDPFGGTGTTALAARALGRIGITVDMSADYCRIAQWRTTDPGQLAQAMGVRKPPPVPEGQPSLLDLVDQEEAAS